MGWVGTNSGGHGISPHRLIPAVLVPVILLALLVMACDSVPSAPHLPDVELPAIPRENSGGIGSTPSPTGSPRPTSTARPTFPKATAAGETIPVPRLDIAEIPADLPEYSRSDWKHWNDTDNDCQNTRAEVLIMGSTVAPDFATGRRCRVTGGSWHGPYTGKVFNDASDLDIDHLVPLKNAHLSGGWQWNDDRREDYANNMATSYHLMAVDRSSNRAKGAGGPEEWQPSNESFHCEYAYYWIAVKAIWGLTATSAEWASLEVMLSRCPLPVEIVEAASPATIAAGVARIQGEGQPAGSEGGGAALPVSTGTPEPFAGALVITELMPDPSAVRDAAGEWFELHNLDPERPVDLQNWIIGKEGEDGHRIAAAVEIQPGGYLVLARNGDSLSNGGVAVGYQYKGLNLTNDGGVIQLVDPTGQVVDRVEYGEGQVFPGASTSLDPEAIDSDANDKATNWCRAKTALPNGDFGTPGGRNGACP